MTGDPTELGTPRSGTKAALRQRQAREEADHAALMAAVQAVLSAALTVDALGLVEHSWQAAQLRRACDALRAELGEPVTENTIARVAAPVPVGRIGRLFGPAPGFHADAAPERKEP